MSEDAIETSLPPFGLGFMSYKKTNATQYGTASTIDFIIKLGQAWYFEHLAGPRLMIGDISIKGGGPCPNGRKDASGNPLHHKSHREGRDFDVQIIRADGLEKARSVTVANRSAIAPTQQLIDAILAVSPGAVEMILTAGKQQFKRSHVVRYDKDHIYHLHVRLRREG